MKKTDILLPLCAAMVLAVSCYRDLSTEAEFTIPDIVIGNLEDTIFVSFGSELSLYPEVSQEGRTEDDFTYLWEMDIEAGRSDSRAEVGTDKDLSMQIANTPNSIPYLISLTVTDRQTGISTLYPIRMFVTNSIGEGMLVAYTRDGGATSDLDLVSSTAVTYGFEGEEPQYVRGLYSLMNDAPLEGRIQALSPTFGTETATYSQSRIMIGTQEHFYYVDPVTYSIVDSDGELLNMPLSGAYNTTAIFNFGNTSTGAIINGSFYGYVTNIPTAYAEIPYPVSPDNITPANLAYCLQDGGDVAVFDGRTGRFYYVPGWQVSSGASFQEISASSSVLLSGAESVAAGGMANSYCGFVIRTADSGYYLFMIDTNANIPVLSTYAMSPTDIENAVSFTFCDNTNIFYYATPDHIYTNYLSGSILTTRAVSWSPDSAGEKITGVKFYRQAWYGTHGYGENGYDFILPTNRCQIIITTYNESTGEGKIYLRGFNVSTGMFTMSGDNGTFDGFGEITAITTTFR